LFLEDVNNKNPIKIEFELTLLKNEFLSGNDFCFNLGINITVNSNEKRCENITIDKNSIEKLISCTKEFSENEEEMFYYEPLEGDFWIYIPKPNVTKNDIMKNLIEKGMSNEYIKRLNSEYTYRLFFLVNSYRCDTGISYCLNITKKMFKELSDELNLKYSHLIYTSI
jgi:hypothetical protein